MFSTSSTRICFASGAGSDASALRNAASTSAGRLCVASMQSAAIFSRIVSTCISRIRLRVPSSLEQAQKVSRRVRRRDDLLLLLGADRHLVDLLNTAGAKLGDGAAEDVLKAVLALEEHRAGEEPLLVHEYCLYHR